MNIKEAKDQIKKTMIAYLTKDELGRYEIPTSRQRPVFLMGPPGIGKTAIMEQIAAELGIGLVSYSMTHHTRQSALGLPYIEKKEFEGYQYDVSEYTMSEIISSVYDLMRETGKREGILFLDEINCVSETLAPSMLQFLQFKTFGRHKVPEGWIVVTAGNPPEYNDSVREFDIVTWDRLKRINVEPDFSVWKEYAYDSGIHPAIITYLDIRKDDFYLIESGVDGKQFVTARGWSDLSDIIRLYEKHAFEVNASLVIQYLQNPTIARNFAVYYDLFMKYRSDYRIDLILQGKAPEDIKERAGKAPFDERLSLLGLILESLTGDITRMARVEDMIRETAGILKNMKVASAHPDTELKDLLSAQIALEEKRLKSLRRSGSLSRSNEDAILTASAYLREKLSGLDEKITAEDFIRRTSLELAARSEGLKGSADTIRAELTAVFDFCREVYDAGQEMMILVTEMTVNKTISHFISRYGCPEYFSYNKELLFYERQKKLIEELSDVVVETKA